MVEQERGCGWRKVGGTYLTADQGMSVSCDALPLRLIPCPCCEYEVDQRRSMVPYPAGYLASLLRDHKCTDKYDCPLCWFGEGYQKAKAENAARRKWNNEHPSEKQLSLLEIPKNFFLMWVSKDYYSPQSFVAEAQKQGISKRIAANSLPTEFVVGRDWVFLAHGEVPFAAMSDENGPVIMGPNDEPLEGPREVIKVHDKAIFYAFKPKRLELVLYKGTPDEEIQAYEEAGYYVVLLDKTPENIERHGNGKAPPLPTGKGKAVRKTGKGRPTKSALERYAEGVDPKDSFEEALKKAPHVSQEAFELPAKRDLCGDDVEEGCN